ncbi:hypothetical protein [Maribacter halichondriae]|uniref:hypothetical protein n=1 Tax=Maribacter halichondriae TaxID=2980554 RepID=UPI00235A0E52|nr:hypothetical protein [Maribacter sp. Hal144]
MIKQEHTSAELLAEFHNDAMGWKSMIGHKENEIRFIKRLLNSKAFTESKPTLFERLQNFKNEIETKIQELESLKKEVNIYETTLKGILECEDIACDTFYQENHGVLKKRFNDFYTGFNEYKTKVFKYTGGIL